jgi:hypothetical protein
MHMGADLNLTVILHYIKEVSPSVTC